MQLPTIDEPAPDFEGLALVDGELKTIKLSDFAGKYLVLFFYPLDFAYVHPAEVIAFSDAIKDFRKFDCEIVGVSTDSKYTHIAWVNTPRKQGGLGDIQIPLLADRSAKVTRAYGVYDESTGLPLRALFVIDDRQTLRHIGVNGLRVGRSVEETRRLVQANQYVDEHGEMCPPGWRPCVKPKKKKPQELTPQVVITAGKET